MCFRVTLYSSYFIEITVTIVSLAGSVSTFVDDY